MSDVYDEILNSSNIQTILEYYGLRISKNKCNCPFHNDKHPSMSIHQGKNIAKCFVCGSGGNAISFVQKYENEINHNSIGVKDAMKKAIEIQGLNIVIPDTSASTLTEEQKKIQMQSNILKDAINISEKNLESSNSESINSLEYLKNRNLSTEIIKFFHIGYAPLNNMLSKELLKKYNVENLKNVGLVNDKNIDVFTNRITIPIFDENGNPVGFGARTLSDTVKPKYINTKETELFNKSNILFNFHKAKSYARNDEIIIVEGYMDVISAKAIKFDNVVGSMGTAITNKQIKLIKKLNCEVTLCLDNDQPGKDAMIRIIPELLKQKLVVNVLDISKLGEYKDFGDLQMANISREQIYQTKISAFTFLLKYQYIKDSELTVETIHNIYNKMYKDGLIKDTKDTLNFKEYIMNNTKFTGDEIDKIINPKEINMNNRVSKYKDAFFYFYIVGLIKDYANRHQESILLKYIQSERLTYNVLMESLDNPNYLKDDGFSISIGSYIKDFIYKSDDYIKFKNDKINILENLLNNVKSFDSKGNIVDITLSIEQKDIILKQYTESFDLSIREYIENNPDEFEEIFIANSNQQFEKLFPKSYIETLKEQAISRFKNSGVMEAVRYGLAYSDEMKSVMTRQFVNNNKYKTLLVFNNNKNILGLSPENIKNKEQELEPEKEVVKQEPIIEKEEKTSTIPMSVFIRLSGNETETYKGMYLPVDNNKQVFVPKKLYKKNEDKIELINSESSNANMSEYLINSKENTKKFNARLSLADFYEKYFKFYEVNIEKEVMA